MKALLFMALLFGLLSHSAAQSPKTSDSAAAPGSPDTSITSSSGASGAKDTLPLNKRALGSLSALKAVTIELVSSEKAPPSGFASLFHHFEVIDERPDTARIGVHAGRYRIGNTRNRQLIFAGPAVREISSYLDARFAHPGAPYTALIVIRTLWLSDANNVWEDMKSDPDKYDEKAKIRLKAEIYAEKNNQYTPVFRFDSLEISLKSNFSRLGRDLAEMLEDLADSSTFLLTKKGDGGRKISRADILQFNQSRFDHFICKDSQLIKGGYASFDEFKDNAPSIQNYEIRTEKKNLLLYMKEAGGNSYYSHTAWGYCDGKIIYVMKDGILVPAWKEGKAWYIFSQIQTSDPKKSRTIMTPGMPAGPGTMINTPGGAILNAGLPAAGPTMTTFNGGDLQQHILTIDMDTGVLY